MSSRHPQPAGPASRASVPGGRSSPRTASVLVVDDEPGMRNFLGKALASRCALVEIADSVETAEALRRRYHFDLLVVDIRLPGESGVDWVARLREQNVHTDVIVMTAYANLETAVSALRSGAVDFLLKPFRIEQLTATVDRCLERRQLARENFLLRRQAPDTAVQGIIGQSRGIQELCDVVQRIAATPATVLLQGETGTGKELVAQAIHDLSGRGGAFVPLNCGSIPPDLLESELFGHTRGAFTSAHAAREGLFSFARGGTIFLDEISELPLAMQAKLLRVLEERRIRPVGADQEVAVDARVIAASNRDLAERVGDGRFRQDLYFRLDVLAVTVPPLRRRVEDIAELARHFSAQLARDLGVPPIPFSHDDVRALEHYHWPGNVRELRNVIERSLLLGKLPSQALAGACGVASADADGALPLDWTLAEVEKYHMLRVLEAAAGNKSEAARRLGVSRKTLERKLKVWGNPGGRDGARVTLFGKLRHRLQGSLRAKLLVLVLFPILLVAPATVGFAVLWSHDFNQRQLLHRVNTDLVVAHDAFSRLQRDYLHALERLAGSHAFFTAFRDRDATRVEELLVAMRATTGFDFLHVTDLQGRWVFAIDATDARSSRRSLLQQRAVTVGAPFVGVEIHSAEDLLLEAPDLAARVRLTLIPTPRAAPTDRAEENRALVVRVVAPVRDTNGTLVGLLDGGVIINKDFQLVDAVRDLVYGDGSLPAGSRGAVTVFLDDVRISTNVPLEPGERALGTRVSQEVRDSVLGRGETFVNRAFVVNDWYISAYEPIVDVDGRRVGMLYTGFLEAPFRRAYLRTVLIAATMLLLGVMLAGAVAVSGARLIARPVELMAAVARDLRAGRERRIGNVGARDELGELAVQFDQTLDLLKLRNEEVRRAADGLEATVEERTAELRDKNRRLEETVALLRTARSQLLAAEKLAALGEVTAGVAHEINNPIAIIQGNLEVMRTILGPAADAVNTEVDLVLDQVRRIHTIVDNLLSYSRPLRRPGQPGPVDMVRLAADTLALVEHEAQAAQVQITVAHEARNSVCIDAMELQQVLVNLLLNGVQASPPGGEVILRCRDWDERGVVIEVLDRGEGIAPGNLTRVFDPFFTTKGSKGTGLGLSVSYGIVQGYGGDIRVHSRPGEGARFEVYLLSQPVQAEDADAA